MFNRCKFVIKFLKLMKKALLIIFISFFTLLDSLSAHPFYVSVTQIDYKENALQITIKIFIDDLEDAIVNSSNEKLNLGTKKENEYTNNILMQYLKYRFSIKVNHNLTTYTFIGKEIENDVIWIYLEVNNLTKINHLEIENTIITELHKSQTNLIHSDINNIKKSLILNALKPADTLLYE